MIRPTDGDAADVRIRWRRCCCAGTVWINSWHADDVVLPRGGYKESGWGRELGSIGLEDYMELKTVIADLSE